ncbi:alpha/beta fold hydrolase [Streptomyces sp. NRRL S-646]|uniref:alpha/beta fold hydrolase n=1 Tax=Streptomyces sp. NRRL S-646 TaxID=1463917 RepID=UPI000690A35C|nr:alpha/beta fold hydrolase [Streptomyces sp. NRRL S-646]
MFTFDVDPAALFEERARQFTAWGIPGSAVARARGRITDMWGTGQGSWVPVWSGLAREAERDGRWLRAAQLWGAARFPALATDDRLAAYERQRECFARAVGRFPVRTVREVLAVPSAQGARALALPVHLVTRIARVTRGRRVRGVLVLSGGVDTWKVELHRMAVATALATGLTVVVIDMPGTGESPLPLAPDGDALLAGLVEVLRERFPGVPVACFGVSFGGHWAVKLAARGVVDAAVGLGGPTGAAGQDIDVPSLPHGMAGIIGNALHLDGPPDAATAEALLSGFSLRRQGLLDATGGAPLLAVNGEHDQYIPRGDTTALASRPDTTVWIVRNATHCAAERIRPVLVGTWGWLLARMGGGVRTETLLRVPVRRHLEVPL